MKSSRQVLGQWGESLAAEYLKSHGFAILERNARTPYGEIDLVTRQEPAKTFLPKTAAKPVLVFIEVKTRQSRAYGLPEESITPRKQAHLIAAAQSYLQAHPEFEGDWRIDVIAIQTGASKENPEIVHFENVVT